MAIYRSILVPTDGTALSMKAVKTAIRLAKALGGRLTGVYVIPPVSAPMYTEGAIFPAGESARWREQEKRVGKKALDAVEAAARAAGVACGSAMLAANSPWEGILKTARSKRCDLIVMSSHGRRGLAGLLLGSETVKVLTHSKLPILVCR